jgi:hypothetical protein
MNIPVRRGLLVEADVEVEEPVADVPRTTAAWACSRAALRASGVFAMGGAGSGFEGWDVLGEARGGVGAGWIGSEGEEIDWSEERGAAGEECVVRAAGREELPLCRAIWSSIHWIMCAALRSSKSGRPREKSTLWQTGHSSSSFTCGTCGSGRIEEGEVRVYRSFDTSPMSSSER